MNLHVILDQPEIPGNTGNLIRLAAVAGFRLHIAGPTLFEFTDTRLKRAGLDYHDLAVMTQHQNLEAAYAELLDTAPLESGTAPNSADTPTTAPAESRTRTTAPPSANTAHPAHTPRIFAFTSEGEARHTDISYAPGDVLLFGRESTGLDEAVKADPRITQLVRIPMLPGVRSLNLANSVSVAVYEAWRQTNFDGAQ